MTLLSLVLLTTVAAPPAGAALSTEVAGRFAALALACVHRPYPNKLAHVLNDARDVRAPRQLTPAFYGCYDWHSAVHGHWLLARLVRLYPDAPFSPAARKALDQSLTPAHIAAEVAYLSGAGRVSFERPYGLAWLLQLAAELREGEGRDFQRWSQALAPLERAAAQRLRDWLPKLSRPIRVGEHDQTAFAFGLVWDWARVAKDEAMTALLTERVTAYYASDRDCPVRFEPGGQDFLSPCLGEADLMRRVLPRGTFSAWLKDFLPGIPTSAGTAWLTPEVVTDQADPKLAHLDGLNLSRAWMLEGIASALDAEDSRLAALSASAAAHRNAGLEAVTGEHYEGGHWLGSFATYLVTRRGLAE